MSPSPACLEFQAHALHGEVPLAGPHPHLADCATCRRWLARLERRLAALGGLERVAAPDELERRVAASLGDDQRVERAVEALRALPRRPAPAELENRLAAALRRAGSEPAAAPTRASEDSAAVRVLETLTRQTAPPVLERLIAEELADPAAARVARAVGSLARLEAPPALELRVQRDLAPRGRQRVPAALAALATAAALLIWLGRPEGSSAPSYRFAVERADSLAELSPLARGFVNGLGGGVLDAERPAERRVR